MSADSLFFISRLNILQLEYIINKLFCCQWRNRYVAIYTKGLREILFRASPMQKNACNSTCVQKLGRYE